MMRRIRSTMRKRMTNSRSTATRPHAILSLLAMLSFAAALLAVSGSLLAQVNVQNGPVNRGPIERVADGKVINKADAPIAGAVVYMKDSKSLAVKTYITDDAGHFHFGQLSQNTDYELWAVSNGSRSKSKAISSFDSKNAYYFSLKVDAGK
jgi:hypothetical protein